MAQLNAEGRLVLRTGRRPQLKRYLADIVLDEPLPSEEKPNSSVAAIVGSFSRALALALARSPEALADVEWRDLERVLAEVCNGLGFRTTLTRHAKDGGFDLEVEADGGRYLIEVKHWSAPKWSRSLRRWWFLRQRRKGCFYLPPAFGQRYWLRD